MNNKTNIRIQEIAEFAQAYLQESYQKRSKRIKPTSNAIYRVWIIAGSIRYAWPNSAR